MSDLVKVAAIAGLVILGIVAAFTFPDVASKVTFGTIIAAIVGIAAGKAMIARLKGGRHE